MKFPFVTRSYHEKELEKLRRELSGICNTGCRTEKCSGNATTEVPKHHKIRKGHTAVHPGKRVLVTLGNGDQFVAKFKDIKGKFHVFYDHARVKSSDVRKLSILTTDYKDKQS